MVLSDAFGYIQTIHHKRQLNDPQVTSLAEWPGSPTAWLWDPSYVGDQIQCEQLEVCVELSEKQNHSLKLTAEKNASEKLRSF